MRAEWLLRTVIVLACLAVLLIPPFAVGTASEFLVWLAAVAAVVSVSVAVLVIVARRKRRS